MPVVTPEELVARLEERILGPAVFTTDEVTERGSTARAEAEDLWQGLGFPPVAEDAAIFTEADVEILAMIGVLRDSELASPEVVLPMTRVLGQALSRVAAAQVEVMYQRLVEALDEVGQDGEEEVMAVLTELLIPGFERFISYVWRRHMAAALRRELLGMHGGTRTVGFVDLVGYTAETRDLDDEGLSALLDRFQQVVYEHVTSAGGRIVKVLGDGVMFAAPTAASAATAALGLVRDSALDGRLNGVHVGLASGHLLGLEGDLFGETVNRASRLTDQARAHTVLADDETAEELLAVGGFEVRRTRPHRLKGLGVVDTWVVRPGTAAEAAR